jgi:hypothetical protein
MKIKTSFLSVFLLLMSCFVATKVYAANHFLIYSQFNGEEAKVTSSLSGKVELKIGQMDGYTVHKNNDVPITLALTVDGVAITQPLTITELPRTMEWDTTTVPDGVHVLSFDILATPNPSNQYIPSPQIVIVDNFPGPVEGNQMVPVCTYWHSISGIVPNNEPAPCDWVEYTGAPYVTEGYPQPIRPGEPFNTRLQMADDELFVDNIMPHLGLFYKTQRFFQTKDGQVFAWPVNTYSGETYESGREFVDVNPMTDGPRNIGFMSAYTSGVVHPDNEHLIFAEMGNYRGRIGSVSLDGTVSTIAGYRSRTDALPFPPFKEHMRMEERESQYELIGNFVGGLSMFRMPTDVVIDPRDSKIIYVADTLNHRIAKVDTHTTPATISTYVGSDQGISGLANGVGTSAKFNEPFSLAMTDDGIMYVADRMNSMIRQVSTEREVTFLVGQGYDSVPSLESMRQKHSSQNRDEHMHDGDFSFASIIYPMCIRLDSNNNLIMIEETFNTIRRIDISNRTVELIQVTPGSDRWSWLDVDRYGTFGPVDDIFITSTTGGDPHSEQIYRVYPDGSGFERVFNGAYNLDLRQRRAPHYPWLVAVGQGALWTNGFGTSGLIRVTKAKDTDRFDTIQELWSTFGPGGRVWQTGTASNFPWGARPSLGLRQGAQGHNTLGIHPSFDQLNHLSDEELASIIQSGWHSQTPRPEITGTDLRNLIYFIRRNSLPGSLSNVRPGSAPTDKTPPEIANVTTTPVAGNRLQIQWQTNEPTLGFARFSEHNVEENQMQRWSDIENEYTTEHSVSIGP